MYWWMCIPTSWACILYFAWSFWNETFHMSPSANGPQNLHCSSPELLTRLGILGSIEGDQVRFRPASRSSAVALPIQTHNPGWNPVKFAGQFLGPAHRTSYQKKRVGPCLSILLRADGEITFLWVAVHPKVESWKMNTCGSGFPRPQIKTCFGVRLGEVVIRCQE